MAGHMLKKEFLYNGIFAVACSLISLFFLIQHGRRHQQGCQKGCCRSGHYEYMAYRPIVISIS